VKTNTSGPYRASFLEDCSNEKVVKDHLLQGKMKPTERSNKDFWPSHGLAALTTLICTSNFPTKLMTSCCLDVNISLGLLMLMIYSHD
jgi:hypothetical protein